METNTTNLLHTVRELFDKVTPMAFDCGRLCEAACCHSEGGMVLLPGEEALYPTLPRGFSLDKQGDLTILYCEGVCRREDRPFACRIFPLMPRFDARGRLAWGMDPRGRGICPLIRQGRRGLDPAFVAAAGQALALLSQDPLQRAYLERLARLSGQYRAMIGQFLRGEAPT